MREVETHLASSEFFNIEEIIDQDNQVLTIARGQRDNFIAASGSLSATPCSSKLKEPWIDVSEFSIHD